VGNLERVTAGRWPEILGALAGVPPEAFNGQAQGCPACARNGIALGPGRNRDRFRWDVSDGMGEWFCNQCGGKRGAGGGGNGVDLLARMLGSDFPTAATKAETYCGLVTAARPVTPGPSSPAPSKRTRKPARIPTAPPTGTLPPELGGAEEQYPYGADLENPDFWIQRIPQPPKVPGGKPGKLFIHRVWLDGRWHRPSKRDDFTSEWPAPRPIYRLPQLLAAPDAPVLVVEGERTANRAALLFPGHAVVAWCHGKEGKQHTDWQPLAGRTVTLWPDNDRDGRAVMAWLAEHLQGLGCTVAVVTPPEGVPAKWDLGDAWQEGWTPERAAAELERLTQPVLSSPRSAPAPLDPPPAQPATSADTSIAGCRQQLGQAIGQGVAGADLAELVAQLASDGGHAVAALGAIARELEREQDQAADAQDQAQAISDDARRIDAGRSLSASILLPAALAAAVDLRTRYLPTDGPSAVVPYLAAVAGMVRLGTQVVGCAAAGYRVPVNLFTCLVGRSGAKKSPVDRLMLRDPLGPILEAQAAADRLARENWQLECRGAKAADRPDPPQPQRLMVSDFTGEALASQLEQAEKAGRGLLIYRDELSGLFGGLNQYRSGRGGDEQQLLELYDGGGLTSLRVTGCRSYSRSQVSIAGNTQPDVLRQLVANGDASGLWARFLFAPLPERAVRLPSGVGDDEIAAIEAAAELLAQTATAVHRLPAITHRLSRAAEDQFLAYELEQQQAALSASLGAHSALHGKSAGKVLRVAGVLHLLALATGQARTGDPIGLESLDPAILLVDYLNRWAIGMHAEVADGGPSGLALAIYRAAVAHGGLATWRDIRGRLGRAHRAGLTAGQCGAILQALADAGYGELERGARGAVAFRAVSQRPT
jgi:hypothetical protein